MNWVNVQKQGERWTVRPGKRPKGAVWSVCDPRGALESGPFLDRQKRAIPNVLWFLELTKAQMQFDAALLESVERFAEWCCLAKDDCAASLETHAPRRVARALRLRLAELGRPVERGWGDGLVPVLAFATATLVALVAWILTILLRYPLRTSAPPIQGTLFAIHAEQSNRTRDLLPPATDPRPDQAYLVLGRSRRLSRLPEDLGLAKTPGGAVLFRAGSWTAALRSTAALPAMMLQGARSVRVAPAVPPWRELVAMNFRVLMGQCHAEWWRSARPQAGAVVYAHTGLADTTALERAQQEAGARTVHLVHGISAGWNFTGASDLGLFRCGFDAEWHRTLPCYGRTVSLPQPRPELHFGGSGWVLCTNYLHPMNPDFETRGAEQELRVLDLVAEAASLATEKPGRIVWKPHPVFGSVEPRIQQAVLERVASHGILRWGRAEDREGLGGFRVVLTTPSTMAIDALRLGHLPIVVASEAWRPEGVLGAFPRPDPDPVHLAANIDRLGDKRWLEWAFSETWERVLPGGTFSPDCLHHLLLRTEQPTSVRHRDEAA